MQWLLGGACWTAGSWGVDTTTGTAVPTIRRCHPPAAVPVTALPSPRGARVSVVLDKQRRGLCGRGPRRTSPPNKSTCCSVAMASGGTSWLRCPRPPLASPNTTVSHIITGRKRRVMDDEINKFKSSFRKDIMNSVQHIFLDQRCL